MDKMDKVVSDPADAVGDVTGRGLLLVETAPDVGVEQIVARTGAAVRLPGERGPDA